MPDPVYRADLLTPYGRELMSWLPPVLQESEDYMAVMHPLSMELARLEDKIELVRDQFFPQTADILLWAWERLVQTAEVPAGVSLEDRRAVVMALLRRGRGVKLGAAWESRVEGIVGPGWSYQEYDPDIPAGPPEGTVRIVVAFAPGSASFATARDAIRAVTPAHLAIELSSADGFRLDLSHLDLEGFGDS